MAGQRDPLRFTKADTSLRDADINPGLAAKLKKMGVSNIGQFINYSVDQIRKWDLTLAERAELERLRNLLPEHLPSPTLDDVIETRPGQSGLFPRSEKSVDENSKDQDSGGEGQLK